MTDLHPHQQKIAEKRYFQKEEKTWSDLVKRVHYAVMRDEAPDSHPDEPENSRLYEIWVKSKNLLLERKFLFNTPTWINAGMDGARTLSACFVGDLQDTMIGKGGILDCSQWFGAVQKFGGGTGIDLSLIRSKGTPITSTHGKACGPLRVLKYLAATSQMITQGGARDGANMAVMSVYHPDITEFITCKSKESKYLLELPMQIAQSKVDNAEWSQYEGEEYVEYCKRAGVFQLFNVSVAVDNKFMQAVQELSNYKARYGTTVDWSHPNNQHDIIEGWSFEERLPCGKRIAEVWALIVEQAHTSGDPGLLFLERAQEFARFHSPLIPTATNPCGEQFLPAHGSCNLGSIDLSKFVVNQIDKYESWKYRIQWGELGEAIKLSVRMLDNVVEINQHPVEEIAGVNAQERRIGLGIMGLADVFFKFKIPYDSRKALDVSEELAQFFKTAAHEASVELAKERGAFPLYKDTYKDQINEKKAALTSQQINFPIVPSAERRNATVTTVAPTGTISLMAGCSSGIEPHFMIGYEHKGLAEHGGLGYIWASDTIREMYETWKENTKNGSAPHDTSIERFESVIRNTHGWKPANEIDIEWHVKHQAIWQKYIDNSISKTLNMSNNATVKDIEDTYLLSYKLGTKGSTVYRDGCKPFQVLNAPKVEEYKSVGEALNNIEYREGKLYTKSSPEAIQSVSEPAGTKYLPRVDGIPPIPGDCCGGCGIAISNASGWCNRCMKAGLDIMPIENKSPELITPGIRIKKKRDEIAHGVTIRVKTGDGSLYVTINRGCRDEPFELFATVGKAGGKAHAYTEALGRIISLALQYNIPIEEISRELRGISSGDPVGFGPNRVLSVPDGIGKAIQEFLKNEVEEDEQIADIAHAPVSVPQEILVDVCPECKSNLVSQAGCSGGMCMVCGFSKCQ